MELQPFLILYSISRPWYRSSIWARKMLLTLPFLRLWKVVLVSYWQITTLFSFFSFQITYTIGLYKVKAFIVEVWLLMFCAKTWLNSAFVWCEDFFVFTYYEESSTILFSSSLPKLLRRHTVPWWSLCAFFLLVTIWLTSTVLIYLADIVQI